MAQPVGDRRGAGQVVALGQNGHRTAGGVPAHHDVRDSEDGDGVLDAGRHPIRAGGMRGHQVAGGADDEQLARLTVREQHRADAGVGAALSRWLTGLG